MTFLRSASQSLETFTFAGMQGRLPIKNLRKLNWVISFMIAVLFFIFVLAVAHDTKMALYRFLQSLGFTLLLTFGNIILLSWCTIKQQREIKIKKSFYLYSYLFAIVDFLLVKYLYSAATGLQWEGEADRYQSYPLAVLACWVINTFIVVIQDLIVLQHKKAQAEIENLQLKGNVSEMSNLLLRQQIHPHFLFNALSTIKSLYKKDQALGEEYLIHLVSFLRVSIANHQTKTTLIKNELDFCLDYLKMQKIRFGSAFDYQITLTKETTNTGFLPYFSLQSLVENALKHNELTEAAPVQILICEDNGYIEVRNTVHVPKYKEASTGQGLANLSERYRLLGEEDIVITSTNAFFFGAHKNIG
jgi:sensor histidine kinase YesM